MLILNPSEKLQKNSREISRQRKSDGKIEFFTFITECQIWVKSLNPIIQKLLTVASY